MADTTITNLIPLIDGYYFTADENQFILYECGTRKKIDRLTRKETDEDMEYQDTAGYYGSLSAMLKSVVQKSIRKGIAKGELAKFTDVCDRIDSLYDRLEDATRGL